MPKHFVEINDLTLDEIKEVLKLSSDPNLEKTLSGKSVTLLFEKASARTRQSMENAVIQLGGHPIYVRPEETGIDERESAEDVARTLGLFNAAIAARVFAHSKLERMASVSKVPIINLLSDETHPIQTLADLLTIQQRFGNIKDVTVAYIGDPNNVSRSLAIGLALFGNKLKVSHPELYDFLPRDTAKFEEAGIEIDVIDDPKEAAKGSDVIYTDSWYSMGQEDEKAQRTSDFADFQINADLMRQANGSAVFMHCLPAHRGLEVTDEVLDGPQSIVWQQAENRMHTARGLLSFLSR